MEENQRSSIRKDLEKLLAIEVRETRQRAEQGFPDPPEAMRYFYDVFSRWENPASFFGAGKTIIGVSCTQVPLELILACDAVPLRLCNGSYALEQGGTEFMPARSCSLVKATVGMLSVFREGLKDRLAMVVVPATCDQKRKAIETLGELAFKVYPMEAPPAKHTEEAIFYWQNSVKKLALTLEKVTGNRITGRRLLAAVHKLQSASSEFRRLSRLQQNVPPLIYGKDLFLVMNAFLYDDLDQWQAAVSRLNDELEVRKKQGKFVDRHAPRILLTGSPPVPPGLKIPLLIEEAGAIIVADEVCSCSRLLSDTVVSGEPRLYDMMAAVADRYLKPCTCPFFDSSQDRQRKLLELARRFSVDGVVYPVYSGCQLYQMEQRGVGNALREAEIPVLFIETDYSPEDSGQMATRIEAFVESIQSKIKRR